MTSTLNRRVLVYWASTGLFCFLMGAGGVIDLIHAEAAVTLIVDSLGYPTYLLTILGVAKLLGVVAIMVPRFPRLKEWAYAGFSFDLMGAALSNGAVGATWTNIVAPLVFLLMLMVSYRTRPGARRLPDRHPD